MEAADPGLVQIVVLALVQGVAEFLPVSSSAHLILPAALSDWPDQGLAFDVAVHCGTLLAALVYFRRELAGFAGSGMAFVTRRARDDNVAMMARIAVATLPIVVAGALFKGAVEAHLRTTTVIGATTLVFGIALWWADGRRAQGRTEESAPAWLPSYWQALLIGAAQALALVPGTSRSGITIAAALALGFARTAALRFSFLLAIPAIGGAALLTGLEADGSAATPWSGLALGFALAAASAFACIAAFMRFVERVGMAPFAIYRILLGAALLLFF